MSDEVTGTTEKTFARCEDCGNEVAAMRGDDGSLVTPHEACQECGGTEFNEVDPDDLDELSDHADWTDGGDDGSSAESPVSEADE
jgi:hypothetical protein